MHYDIKMVFPHAGIGFIAMKNVAKYGIRLLRLMAIAVLMASGCVPAHAARQMTSWTGVVVYVVDGDTVHVQPAGGGRPVSVRIEGIDAPEICQPGGAVARSALQGQVAGRAVTVKSRAHDVYGRVVGQLVLGQVDQGRWMVSQGFAWANRNRRSLGQYAAEERRAQARGAGIFAGQGDAAAAYPADFRKRHGSCYSPRPKKVA